MKQLFEKIILLGRPASGKSEVINYIKKTSDEERRNRFHIGKFVEIDDFPMLWTWFEEDDILEKKFGKPRLHSDSEGYFLHEYFWHLLIERISFDYSKSKRDLGDKTKEVTHLIEFSRGTEHGGYKEAFKHLSNELLENAAIVYVNVPFEESLRKNRKRFNPDKPDSILEHGLPDSKLTKMYKEVDFHEVIAGDDTFIDINGVKVPYVIFENMPSKTDDPALLGPALDEVIGRLWNTYNK
ncbi:MAG: hypothetical protein NTY74_08410 [Ignavibacteriae bacterium]|nr:hypothetical protein [Ignavibacteriota bacterium]